MNAHHAILSIRVLNHDNDEVIFNIDATLSTSVLQPCFIIDRHLGDAPALAPPPPPALALALAPALALALAPALAPALALEYCSC